MPGERWPGVTSKLYSAAGLHVSHSFPEPGFLLFFPMIYLFALVFAYICIYVRVLDSLELEL